MSAGGPLKGPYDEAQAAADVAALGGLGIREMALLDERPNDTQRRLTLVTWFGRHGARYAWGLYQQHRARTAPTTPTADGPGR
jgi:hypothetical protein